MNDKITYASRFCRGKFISSRIVTFMTIVSSLTAEWFNCLVIYRENTIDLLTLTTVAHISQPNSEAAVEPNFRLFIVNYYMKRSNNIHLKALFLFRISDVNFSACFAVGRNRSGCIVAVS